MSAWNTNKLAICLLPHALELGYGQGDNTSFSEEIHGRGQKTSRFPLPATALLPEKPPLRHRCRESNSAKATPAKSASTSANGIAALTKRRRAGRLPPDADDPPFRGEGRPALRHGSDRRFLSSLHRSGSCRRWHAQWPSAMAIKSSPDTATMAASIACGMEARGVMAELTGRRGGYSGRQGRLDAHV